MSDDAENPSGEVPARSVVRAAKRRRLPENLRATVKLDGRTVAAKMLAAFRAELVAHVGGKPSAVQSALIEQAAQIKLRLFAMDANFAERGEQSAHDAKQYLAWANSMTRLIRQLGLKGAATNGPSLGEYLARRGAGTKAAAS